MQPEPANEAILDKRLDDLCDGLHESIDPKVETLRREGMPVYVRDNGKVADLQHARSSQ